MDGDIEANPVCDALVELDATAVLVRDDDVVAETVPDSVVDLVPEADFEAVCVACEERVAVLVLASTRRPSNTNTEIRRATGVGPAGDPQKWSLRGITPRNVRLEKKRNHGEIG